MAEKPSISAAPTSHACGTARVGADWLLVRSLASPPYVRCSTTRIWGNVCSQPGMSLASVCDRFDCAENRDLPAVLVPCRYDVNHRHAAESAARLIFCSVGLNSEDVPARVARGHRKG